MKTFQINRMIATLLLGCGLIVTAIEGAQAQVYRTETKQATIKTLLIHPINDWKGAPVINLGSEDRLLVSFDELSHDYKRYAYRIVHCDKNWKKSNLNVLEYLEGFQENDIEAYGTSSNTLTNYTHYAVTLPNEQVSLKLSGNYAIEIVDRDDSKKVILTACFNVLDAKTAIEGLITANTEIDTELNHQQVQFTVNPLGLIVQQPESEISVRVCQNQMDPGKAKFILPDRIDPDKWVYEHHQDLVFEGGNEFRRFEITTYKHAGIGINRIEFFAPYYNAELFESKARDKGYIFDKDQNGRFLIHNTDYTSDETHSDYFLVHFSYPMDVPLQDTKLYLYGDLVENKLDENSRMVYNSERKAYEKTLFLKQGSYNYTYVSDRYSGRLTEGSYWQTENEYQIYVYYKPMGSKYDQLIGFATLRSSF